MADWATLQSMTAVVLVALETRDAELARRLLSYRPEGADHGYRPSSLQLIRGSCAARRGDLPTALEYFLDWGRSAERADWRNPAVLPGVPGPPGCTTGWARPAGPTTSSTRSTRGPPPGAPPSPSAAPSASRAP
ncbi:hypothetical protein [Streptomyces griseocarneus]|uniref:LuxR family transcriptional regulator n=1 Tax=Streptomyces griseocarneus TaxID=51201 RepID=A0ABX7RQE2_9ACTN|nr:hypothetical protein [Streptomyces griseocarneus]QSY50032.1 hypothetical protein J3S04_02905 [Streptomyces griseocarneus]